MCLLAVVYFLWRSIFFSNSLLWPKKIGLLIFLLLSYRSFLCILDINLVNSLIHRYFLQFCILSFHFLVNILWCSKVYNLMRSVDFLLLLVLLMLFLRIHTNQWVGVQLHTFAFGNQLFWHHLLKILLVPSWMNLAYLFEINLP